MLMNDDVIIKKGVLQGCLNPYECPRSTTDVSYRIIELCNLHTLNLFRQTVWPKTCIPCMSSK